MGASGKKLRGHGAPHKQNSPAPTPASDGWEPVPHRRRVINGQRYSPHTGKRRRPFTVTSHLTSGAVFAVKVDGRQERVRLSAERLLAAGEDGLGTHYPFIAYTAARRYRTYAYLVSIEDRQAQLLIPDWHPRRPVRLPAALLPDGAREPGAWIACTADLGQAHGAKLNLAQLTACAD